MAWPLPKQEPIAFVLWWLPPVNSDGVPYSLEEHILNPMHKGTRELLRRLGNQKYLHVALIGAVPRVRGLHEFKNEYGFFDLYSYAQAAAERGWPGGYDFDAAYSAYQRDFSVEGLLHGRYPDNTLMAGDAPDF